MLVMRKLRAVRFTTNLFGTYAFVGNEARMLRGMPAFMNGLLAFKWMLGDRSDWTFGPMMPMLDERGTASGSALQSLPCDQLTTSGM